jgi:hypothetical protein
MSGGLAAREELTAVDVSSCGVPNPQRQLYQVAVKVAACVTINDTFARNLTTC